MSEEETMTEEQADAMEEAAEEFSRLRLLGYLSTLQLDMIDVVDSLDLTVHEDAVVYNAFCYVYGELCRHGLGSEPLNEHIAINSAKHEIATTQPAMH